MSGDNHYSMAFPHCGGVGLLCVIVVFPDHTIISHTDQFEILKKGLRRKSIDFCKSVTRLFNIRNTIRVCFELTLICINNTANTRSFERELTRFNCIYYNVKTAV